MYFKGFFISLFTNFSCSVLICDTFAIIILNHFSVKTYHSWKFDFCFWNWRQSSLIISLKGRIIASAAIIVIYLNTFRANCDDFYAFSSCCILIVHCCCAFGEIEAKLFWGLFKKMFSHSFIQPSSVSDKTGSSSLTLMIHYIWQKCMVPVKTKMHREEVLALGYGYFTCSLKFRHSLSVNCCSCNYKFSRHSAPESFFLVRYFNAHTVSC